MSDNRRVYIQINHPTDRGRNFVICNDTIVGCPRGSIKKYYVVSLCPKLVRYLSGMMEPCSIVRIDSAFGGETEICLEESVYAVDTIFCKIREIISKSVHLNLSVSDANIIIRSLNISQYVYCVETDGAECLVVFEEFKCFPYDQKMPWSLFKDAVLKFNESRTVVMTLSQNNAILTEEIKPSVEFSSVLPDRRIQLVFKRDAIQTVIPEINNRVEYYNLRTVIMTPAQFDTLLSEEMKPSVEFTSVRPDGQIEVVFRQESILTDVPEIKKQVEIDNLRRRLEELKSS